MKLLLNSAEGSLLISHEALLSSAEDLFLATPEALI